MFESLPTTTEEFIDWPWTKIEPYFKDLERRTLGAENVGEWLADWTRLSDLILETHARLNVAITVDTTDQEAERRYHAYLDGVYPASQAANQALKEKLLASGLEPEGLGVPLLKMRAEAEIFRQENLPLLSEEHKLGSQYNKMIGAQTVPWEGETLTLQQLRTRMMTPDRARRERAWRLAAERQLADREALNELWGKLFHLRGRLAANAGFANYRSLRWKQMLRLDYTPRDSLEFQKAIEQVAVPAATRCYERYKRQLGVESLRPWDLDQDLYSLEIPPLPSYGTVEELQLKVEAIFRRLDPQLGEYFGIMSKEGLLDLANYPGKAPGGYCTSFPARRRPFIFMNAVGLASDVRTILHESGHAFHNFERFQLPYAQQRVPGLEFAEVASMAMELLAAPYLEEAQGGFYAAADARRYRIAHLEHILTFWPYMAVVDAFQHWAYTHQTLAADPANCDACWLELWGRYLPGVDWSGLEAEAMTGWQRKQHIFRVPLYYVEYGLAQMGSIQVWNNALRDPSGALRKYRQALSLGGTVTLPELYNAAGARLAFEAGTLGEAVALIEGTIEALEAE
jgi:oligoendopeptidase F